MALLNKKYSAAQKFYKTVVDNQLQIKNNIQ